MCLPGPTRVTTHLLESMAVPPNVVVTPESDLASLRYWVTKTTSQFMIHLSGSTPADVKFDYFVQQ